MENLLLLWNSSGLAQFTTGQGLMILIGITLLYLAINRGFEPLLLVPIGFGGILANIPGAGLAFSAVENAVFAADPQVLSSLAVALGADLGTAGHALLDLYHIAGAQAHTLAIQTALDAGFDNGIAVRQDPTRDPNHGRETGNLAI